MKPEIESYKEFSDDELLEQEKNIFGFYLSHHPTTNYYRDNKECIRLNDIKNYFMIIFWMMKHFPNNALCVIYHANYRKSFIDIII